MGTGSIPAVVSRRRFLARTAKALLGAMCSSVLLAGEVPAPMGNGSTKKIHSSNERSDSVVDGITLFLCGDVMTGRGIDQILPHPGKPHLYESYVRTARGYVEIAEKTTGPIRRPVDFAYIWGDALSELERMQPAARIINLETTVTTSEQAWPRKGIHYRMHPANVPCLSAARIDCCVLANNHVLDWGHAGLAETLETLHAAHIRTAGAGRNHTEAEAPAIIELPAGGRVLIFAFGSDTAGVPDAWAATPDRAGVNVLQDLSPSTADSIARQVGAVKQVGDIVVASIHWGENWGYGIEQAQRDFAHRLIDGAGVDLVHGHSSHHPQPIEVYRDKLILYGCGDFLNDYEGISGNEAFRADLTLMYFPTIEASTGRLTRLELTPMQIRHFRVNHVGDEDANWLATTLSREGREFGTRVKREGDRTLVLDWR